MSKSNFFLAGVVKCVIWHKIQLQLCLNECINSHNITGTKLQKSVMALKIKHVSDMVNYFLHKMQKIKSICPKCTVYGGKNTPQIGTDSLVHSLRRQINFIAVRCFTFCKPNITDGIMFLCSLTHFDLKGDTLSENLALPMIY